MDLSNEEERSDQENNLTESARNEDVRQEKLLYYIINAMYVFA